MCEGKSETVVSELEFMRETRLERALGGERTEDLIDCRMLLARFGVASLGESGDTGETTSGSSISGERGVGASEGGSLTTCAGGEGTGAASSGGL